MGMLCFFPDCWFRNPADQMIWKISHFSSGYMSRYLYIYIIFIYTYQVVQDFFHHQYVFKFIQDMFKNQTCFLCE